MCENHHMYKPYLYNNHVNKWGRPVWCASFVWQIARYGFNIWTFSHYTIVDIIWIYNHNIEIKKIPRILSFFYYRSSVMSKAISAAIQRALAKTKYSHLVTGAEFDLTNREVIPKPLHSAIAPVEKFFKPNSSLKWHILDDPEMGMHSVRYSGNTGYAK